MGQKDPVLFLEIDLRETGVNATFSQQFHFQLAVVAGISYLKTQQEELDKSLCVS
jgi:hypothetical protein